MTDAAELSPFDFAQEIERVFCDAAHGRASIVKEVDAHGVIWVVMTPHNPASAPAEARIDGPNAQLTIGEGATFEFPYWSARSTFDKQCLSDIADLVSAVFRGEVGEWGDARNLQFAPRSGASIGEGRNRVETGRQSLFTWPWRKRQNFTRTYE